MEDGIHVVAIFPFSLKVVCVATVEYLPVKWNPASPVSPVRPHLLPISTAVCPVANY